MSENKGVLVYCETDAGDLAAIAQELFGAGNRIASALGEELSALIIGSGIVALANKAIAHGAGIVYLVDDPVFKDYAAEPYSIVVEKVVRRASPSVILFGQTAIGRDLAPRLAFQLDTAATMDCLALEIDPATRRLLMTRPVYGGNALAVQYSKTGPQIAAVRVKAMTPSAADLSLQGQIISVEPGIDSTLLKTRVVERRIDTVDGVKLEDARMVVAGGRGIGSAAGFEQLAELARVLGGAVGATRPPCDAKWVPDSRQIGLTGKIVSPELYIAVGLSGSSQHIAGCASSKLIVAINKDPEANIFKIADYGIVADWQTALPALTAKLKQLV